MAIFFSDLVDIDEKWSLMRERDGRRWLTLGDNPSAKKVEYVISLTKFETPNSTFLIPGKSLKLNSVNVSTVKSLIAIEFSLG